METAAVQPMSAMRIAFTRGAARQFGGAFLYYHAPNFGDTATTFTKAQNFAGPDHFFHSRYGADDGAFALVVSKELLPLLHVGRVGDLSRAGLRSVFQARPGRASIST